MAVTMRNNLRERDGAGGAAEQWLLTGATWGVLALPIILPYARSIADAVLSVAGILFLLSRAARSDWGWLRVPHTRLMFLLWVWMLLCTLVTANVQAIEQALAGLRLFVFVAALEYWVLADPATRRRLWHVFIAVAAWIAVECWQQYLFGTSLPGYRRFADGALTGPFLRPIAGGTYLAVLFPAILPLCLMLLRRGGRLERIGAVAVLGFAVATMLLIGQRMPSLLMLLGLCVTGLLFRQLRVAVVLTLVAGALLLALLPVVSPPTFAKLVLRFTQQMETFWQTPYGWIFGRAVTMIQANPWLGLGWDGFRDNCMQPAYLGGVSWLPIADPANPDGCNIHPHNYWLQIATSAGLPGLALFAALAVAWLRRIAGGMDFLGNDRRAALLVIVFVMLWPIASATSLFTVPNAGWVFLLVGWGLAEARYPSAQADAPMISPGRIAL
jgi:O-antigen ligase